MTTEKIIKRAKGIANNLRRRTRELSLTEIKEGAKTIEALCGLAAREEGEKERLRVERDAALAQLNLLISGHQCCGLCKHADKVYIDNSRCIKDQFGACCGEWKGVP